MRKRKASNVSSERRNWENIFNGLVQMLHNMQQQLQALVKERKFLEDRVKMQHDGWASEVRFYKDRMSEMEGLLMFEEKKRLLEGAKAAFVLGSEHREACITKWILEHLESELEDFKACFECLSQRSSNGEGPVSEDTEKNQRRTRSSEKKSSTNVVGVEKCSKKVEEELRRLKQEYEKLALEKDSEVLALLAEKKFVWNQYNIMENGHLSKLRNKQAEVELANEKIDTLVSSMEQLQSAIDEKDATISSLESKVAFLEADTKRLNEDKSRLSAELESLKSRNTQVTPVLNRCTTGIKPSETGGNGSSRSGNSIAMNKETSAPNASGSSMDSGKLTRSLKRKGGPVIPPSETPKLFSSKFKVPKLKNPSQSIR